MEQQLTTQPDERLDSCVAAQLPDFSRSTIRKFIDQGYILVNGSDVKANHRLKESDVISAKLPDLTAEVIDLPIIFENTDVIVIDKPAGILTHSKGILNHEGTVASFIANRLDDSIEPSNRAGIVHRLDRDTSGVIICAKNEAGRAYLQRQFSDRKVKKTYLAVVEGHLKDAKAILAWPIGRNPKKPQTFRVDPNGKTAETIVTVLKSSEHFDLLELLPKTGRTHQLRVHLSHLGHPIIGDRVYGKVAERLLLHAKSLEITLPGGDRHTFTSPVPSIFNTTLAND